MKIKKDNYAFVDSQNLNLGVQGMGWYLDFAKFFVYLKDKYKIKKVFLFIGYMPGNEALYTYLQQAGYIVVFKPTLEYKKEGEIFVKGNVDAELVLHTMIQYDHYSKALIVSGDGDFHCLVEYLRDNNKLFGVMIPNSRKYSALLRKFRKYFIYLDGLKHKLRQNKKPV
ncbi:MAG: NYN domain-containing protein [Patescibacteria group bacterium]